MEEDLQGRDPRSGTITIATATIDPQIRIEKDKCPRD